MTFVPSMFTYLSEIALKKAQAIHFESVEGYFSNIGKHGHFMVKKLFRALYSVREHDMTEPQSKNHATFLLYSCYETW
jgi:hypothetical protein